MLDQLRQLILTFLRVPPEPHAPAGAPGALRTFRAAPNYYHFRVVAWGVAQMATLVGILVSLQFLRWLDADISVERARQAEPAPAVVQPADGPATSVPTETTQRARGRGDPRPNMDGLATRAARLPEWAFLLIKVAEGMAIVGFVLLIPATFVAVRLDYDYRWYLVTDRSLRIRTGIWKLQETTMSFANLQQVEMSQGPVQRLLGIADVRVTSAGGGGGKNDASGRGRDSMHEAVFQGVDNAIELRDLILDRLRRYREAGLGDPDDHPADRAAGAPVASTGGALAAAKEVLAEARALRTALRG
ncbi:hypothetical protein MASR2M8_19290 [Opitutaceae bacterium]